MVVEKGEIWDVSCVCPTVGLAKRMAKLSRDIIGTQRAVARDLRAGESFIVMQCKILFERKLFKVEEQLLVRRYAKLK